jgi:hypothetical protein
MPRFTVKTTRRYIAVITYTVDAPDEDLAWKLVDSGDAAEGSSSSPDWDGDEELMEVFQNE